MDIPPTDRRDKGKNELVGVKEEIPPEFNYGFIILTIFTVSLGGFMFGYDIGVIQGANRYLHDSWPNI